MSRGTVALAIGLVVALAATGWLYRENRQLQQKLSSARAAAAPPGATSAAAPPLAAGDSVSPESRARSGNGAARAFLRGLGRAASRERPTLEGQPKKKETRQERRLRRQERIAAMLGRAPGETEEQYRARMVPLIELGLSGPRGRMKDLRKEMEQKAGIDSDQRAKMDQVFEDTYKEVIAMTNKAVADGDLTPYSRNWSGILSYAGGLGAVLGNAEGRLNGILSPEQLRIISSSGFEWGEYLGVNAPWESLQPPPPPPTPNNDG